MEYKMWKIIEELSDGDFKTASYLGSILGISEKTTRTRIKDWNSILKKHGAEIISKQRYGYSLHIESSEKWEEFINQKDKNSESIPAKGAERVNYLLATLLNRNDYIKLSDMSEFLYISHPTLSYELKKVEFTLNKFDITLERKPYYGIRLIGREFDKRRCILQNFMLSTGSFLGMEERWESETKRVASILLDLLNEYNIKFTETAFQNLVLYIYISISRMKKGMYVETPKEEENLISEKDREAAKVFFHRGLAGTDIAATDAEIYYAGIYIAGKKIIHNAEDEPNLIIPDRIDKLVLAMLDEVYSTYKVDLRDNLNLRIMLNQHLMPLDIRLKYGIPMENPMLDEIREKYSLAFTMAQQASVILAQYYNKPISDDEIGYIALALVLALEERKTIVEKKTILLVCASGKASSQLLVHKFKQEFKDYIKALHTCSMYEFNQYDLSEIDYIFTTVPIYKKTNIPILEIHDFLERKEIASVKELLQIGDLQFLKEFYKEKFFFTDIEGDTREEVLEKLCHSIAGISEVPQEFYESVLKREALAATDYGNLVAIPHPFQIMTKETIVGVAVLPKEILWNTQRVRVVILISLSEKKEENTHKFYDVTAKFLENKSAILQLIENPSFDIFTSLLRELGNSE